MHRKQVSMRQQYLGLIEAAKYSMNGIARSNMIKIGKLAMVDTIKTMTQHGSMPKARVIPVIMAIPTVNTIFVNNQIDIATSVDEFLSSFIKAL